VPRSVASLHAVHVAQVACGAQHTLVCDRNGVLYRLEIIFIYLNRFNNIIFFFSFGGNAWGELGHGDRGNHQFINEKNNIFLIFFYFLKTKLATRTLPVAVRALKSVVNVAAGQAHSAALCTGTHINIIKSKY